MEQIISRICDQKVYPVVIRNNGVDRLTFLYYTERDEEIFHSEGVLYFPSPDALESFCRKYELNVDESVYLYDFDRPIRNPVDCRTVLNDWNLLNTIAGCLSMYFEGNSRKYNYLYNLLFRISLPIEPGTAVFRFSGKYYGYILKVFRKKDRFLKRFVLFRE